MAQETRPRRPAPRVEREPDEEPDEAEPAAEPDRKSLAPWRRKRTPAERQKAGRVLGILAALCAAAALVVYFATSGPSSCGQTGAKSAQPAPTATVGSLDRPLIAPRPKPPTPTAPPPQQAPTSDELPPLSGLVGGPLTAEPTAAPTAPPAAPTVAPKAPTTAQPKPATPPSKPPATATPKPPAPKAKPGEPYD